MFLKCIFRHLSIRRGGGLLPASVFLAALLGVMAVLFAQPTSNEEAQATQGTGDQRAAVLMEVDYPLATDDMTINKLVAYAVLGMTDGFVNSLRNASVKDLSITMSTADLMQAARYWITRLCFRFLRKRDAI